MAWGGQGVGKGQEGKRGMEVNSSPPSVAIPAPQTVINYHGPVTIHYNHQQQLPPPQPASFRQCSQKWRCRRPAKEGRINGSQPCIDNKAKSTSPRQRAKAILKKRYKLGAARKGFQQEVPRNSEGKREKKGVKRAAKEKPQASVPPILDTT